MTVLFFFYTSLDCDSSPPFNIGFVRLKTVRLHFYPGFVSKAAFTSNVKVISRLGSKTTKKSRGVSGSLHLTLINPMRRILRVLWRNALAKLLSSVLPSDMAPVSTEVMEYSKRDWGMSHFWTSHAFGVQSFLWFFFISFSMGLVWSWWYSESVEELFPAKYVFKVFCLIGIFSRIPKRNVSNETF